MSEEPKKENKHTCSKCGNKDVKVNIKNIARMDQSDNPRLLIVECSCGLTTKTRIDDEPEIESLEMAKKEFHDEVDNILDLPLHIYNYIKHLEMKLALTSDYAEILEEDKKTFRELLNESRVKRIRLQVQKDHMTRAMKCLCETDLPIGSGVEIIHAFKKMIKAILDE